MGIFSKFRKQKVESDVGAIFDVFKALHGSMAEDGGINADELPNGYGRFGFDITNPIPCQTILGSHFYLERLVTLHGVKVRSERIGSFDSDVVSSPVDGYTLMDPAGAELGTIYISAYQGRNSNKAPAGFKLS